MNTTEILEALNSYNGQDLFNDVVYGIDGYDEEATEAADPNFSNDVYVIDGVEYRNNMGVWSI